MAIKSGRYDNVLLAHTLIDELLEYQNKHGTLLINENNIIIFEIDGKRFPLLIISSLGDFSVPSSNELWLGTDQGEILFKREYANPLWEFEKEKDKNRGNYE